MDLKALKEIPTWNWPKGAETVVRDVLLDDTAEVPDRCIAAELAGDFAVINDELARALLSILASPDQAEPLRACAAIALGPALENADTMGFDDPDDEAISEMIFEEVKSTLRRRYEDPRTPKLVKRRILEASVRAAAPWHEEAVAAADAGDDPEWRLTAVFCMRFVQGFDDRILEALTADDPEIHYQAICAAGNAGLEGAWPHVMSIINRPDTVDRPLLLAAIEAVANIRPKSASDVLDDLAHSDDEEISEAVLDALSLAGGLEEDEILKYDEEEYY
jgi:hypothetical protein